MSAALHRSIADFAAGGLPVDRIVDARCGCGGERFLLVLDDVEGVAARVCTACEEEFGIADSEERFDDVESVEQAECTCGGEEFRIATGFAIGADGEVRWVSVGAECLADGVAGVYVDWRIDYAPTVQLLDRG